MRLLNDEQNPRIDRQNLDLGVSWVGVQPRVTKASREEVVDKYLGAHGWPSEEGPSYVSLMYGSNRYPEMIPPNISIPTTHITSIISIPPTSPCSYSICQVPSAPKMRSINPCRVIRYKQVTHQILPTSLLPIQDHVFPLSIILEF